ncbi:MAG: signal recognition particle receptor subunit alpha, partial [Nakamurella sp.]
MSTWIWIVLAVVLVLVVAVGVGLLLGRRRRISIVDSPQDAGSQVTAPPVKGGYKAGSSISLSPGGSTAVAPRPPVASPPAARPATTQPPAARPATTQPPAARPPVPEQEPERTEVDGQPGVGDDASVPRDSARRDIVDVALPDVALPDAALPDVALPDAAGPDTGILSEFPPLDELSVDELLAVPPTETIEPPEGRLGRLRGRLSRSQNAFGKSLLGLLGAGTLDEDSWADVEDTLLMADLGAAAAAEITDKLRRAVAAHGVTDSRSARALLRRVLIEAVEAAVDGKVPDRSLRALPHDGRPAVLLVVGVNGTGKTTTTGKLARVLVADGRSVVLAAADTFRAAAADQLQTWGDRAGATVVRSVAGADPAAVAFDAVKRGIADEADAVLIDTAGRLHTKTGLMDELGKVKRVVEKLAELDEILLVL